MPQWTDDDRFDFLVVITDTDKVEVTDWEADFVDNMLDWEGDYTSAQAKAIDKMIEKYRDKINW